MCFCIILLLTSFLRRNKAVAHGAVCFYLERLVSARVIKLTYGVDVVVDYDEYDPEHYARRGSRFTRPSGRVMIPNGFSPILLKVLVE